MKPLNNKIQLDIKEEKIGMIQTDTIAENGIIVALGDFVSLEHRNKYNIGDRLYFKAWAVDVITVGDKKFYFIDADSDAICAIDNTK